MVPDLQLHRRLLAVVMRRPHDVSFLDPFHENMKWAHASLTDLISLDDLFQHANAIQVAETLGDRHLRPESLHDIVRKAARYDGLE